MIAIKDLSGRLVWFHPDSIREIRVISPNKTKVLIVHPGVRDVSPMLAEPCFTVVTERKAMDIARDIQRYNAGYVPEDSEDEKLPETW